jgi:REP element-mobilizing transposase RayT
VYFITARCRGRFPAFASEEAKAVFWDRLTFSAEQYGIVLLIVSLLDNHYHMICYVKVGESVGPFMRHFHGAVAKLVNDLLAKRLKPFWYDSGKQGYFDGCLRNQKQHCRAHRYTRLQSVRHRVARNWREYRHTREYVDVERAIRRALEFNSYMEDVPYKRYLRPRE